MSWDRRSAEAKEFPFAKGIYAYPTPITIHDPLGVMMDTDPWGSSPQERLERGASFERGRMIIFFRPGYVGSLLLNCGNLRTAFGKHVGDCGCFFSDFERQICFCHLFQEMALLMCCRYTCEILHRFVHIKSFCGFDSAHV